MRSLARWQDWAVFALGLWLAVSPWLAGYSAVPPATANAAVTGLVLAVVAHFEASCELSVEWLTLGSGAWLVIAPFILGFADAAVPAANSVAVGGAVVALAGSSLQLARQLTRR